MFVLNDIELPEGGTLKVEKVADGMYCFPDAYKTIKQDFFQGLMSPIHTRPVAPMDRAPESNDNSIPQINSTNL